MRLRTLIVAFVFSMFGLCQTAIVSGQSPRATVVTKTGEVIEGSLFFASDTEIIIMIAAQQIKVPISNIRYVSFVGKLVEGSPTGGSPAAAVTPLQEALKSFESLAAAAEIGMLRDQYSQKLLETMPAVRRFIKTGPNWTDVRLAMEQAADAYSYPLSSVAAWGSGSESLARGRLWAEHAAKLAALPGEETHSEQTNERALPAMVAQQGRLGYGDQMMTEALDRSSAGGFNDVYVFELPVKSAISIVMECTPCQPHLTLVDGTGKKLEGDAGINNKSTIKRTLNPGTYRVWAGSFVGQVGSYTLVRQGQ